MKIIKKNKPSKIKNMKKNVVLSLEQQEKIKGGTDTDTDSEVAVEEMELAVDYWELIIA